MVTDGDGLVADILGAEVDALVDGVLVAVVDEVVAALPVDELVAALAGAVDVEVAVLPGTVLDDQLAAVVKVVVAGSQLGAGHELLAQVEPDVSGVLVGVVDEVVVAGFGKAAGLGFAVVEVVGPPGAFFILFLWAIIAAIILFVVPPLSS